jgi:hypothetical protein
MRLSDAGSIMAAMDERGILHRIEDDLSKHLAFLSFLDEAPSA